MTRICRFTTTLAAMAILSSSAFGQVNFAFEWNVQEPEEVEGWDGDAIRIVFDEVGNSQNGVTFDNAVTGAYEKIEFDFEFRFLNDPATPEGVADGIGFTYANVDVFGESAEDDLFPNHSGEEPNLEGSIGVGFDTWMNAAIDDETGEFVDGTLPNSFSLHYDGQRLVTTTMDEYDLGEDWIETPSVKRAHIEIVPGDPDALITVQVTDTESGVTVTAFDNEPVPDFEPYDGRMTFRARTGGEWADSDIDNISLTHTATDGTVQTIVHYGQHVGAGAGVVGDFDGDGALGIGDIDAMLGAVKSGANDPGFDLTGDAVVNGDDVAALLEGPFNSFVGDANLDGEFNSTDFVFLFTAGQYDDGVPMNSSWGTGDFNGDGDFDSGDFVAAFSRGGYEAGPREPVAAVPEPSSAIGLLLGLLALIRRSRI